MAQININLDALKPKKDWKRHKVQPGHNLYRMLPPFGDTSNGYPYKKWMITWGLLDPESGRMRPYASSLTTGKKCPIMEYVDALSLKAETIKNDLSAKGATDADIKEHLKELNKVISNLRPKTVFAYNAANKAGEVGILEIKATAHKKLKELMMQYINDYAQDPTSLNSDQDDSGVWFDISRQGEGFNTEYDVAKVQIKVKDPTTGRTAFVDDQSALPDNVVKNYEQAAYDLTSIYQVKSYEELKDILLANIKNIVELCPEAAIEGFGDDFTPPSTGNTGGGQARSNNTTGTTVKTTKPVNLKLDSLVDEEDDFADFSSSPLRPGASIDDDVFAMAESILR